MNNTPLVSIGMPVFNGAKFISQALEALLRQDYESIEIIISDNASTDETEILCREFVAKDSRIRYYRNSVNLGVAPNFGRLVELANGEYFMWAAHDDLWEATYVSTMVKLLTANSQAVSAFCAFDNIDYQNQQSRLYPDLFALPSPDLFQRLWHYLMQPEGRGKANIIYGLMPTAVLRLVEPEHAMQLSLGGSDMLLVFKLLSYGELVLSPNLLFHKRNSEGSDSTKTSSSVQRTLVYFQTRLSYFSGYYYVINKINNLKKQERIILKLGVGWRILQLFSLELVGYFGLAMRNRLKKLNKRLW